jgi:Reverse transcriptase (RNA-dependent DNA polymerase)
MASPVVCVLKGKPGDECRAVRLTVNYQYVNKFTVLDVMPLPDIGQILQNVGRARYISVYDARSGYHQCPVRKEDQWLTAFVCGSQLYEWTRCPFGMRSSGCTFVRAIKQIIDPLKDFIEI